MNDYCITLYGMHHTEEEIAAVEVYHDHHEAPDVNTAMEHALLTAMVQNLRLTQFDDVVVEARVVLPAALLASYEATRASRNGAQPH